MYQVNISQGNTNGSTSSHHIETRIFWREYSRKLIYIKSNKTLSSNRGGKWLDFQKILQHQIILVMLPRNPFGINGTNQYKQITRKWKKPTKFSTPFEHSSLPTGTKIPCLRISFRVNITYIENKYGLYSRTFTYGSYMLEGVELNVSYTYVARIKPLKIIIAISSTEGLTIFILDIYKAFQNTILPNPEEMVYLSLPNLYLEWFKIKWPKHTLWSGNTR